MAARIVQCPVCRTQLHEPPGVPLFTCVCGTVLRSSSCPPPPSHYPPPPPPSNNGNFAPPPYDRFSSFGSDRPPSSGSLHSDPPDISNLSLQDSQRPPEKLQAPEGSQQQFHQCTKCGGFLQLPENLPRDKNGFRKVRCGSCNAVNKIADPGPESPTPAPPPTFGGQRRPFAYEQTTSEASSSPAYSGEQVPVQKQEDPAGYSAPPAPSQSSYPPSQNTYSAPQAPQESSYSVPQESTYSAPQESTYSAPLPQDSSYPASNLPLPPRLSTPPNSGPLFQSNPSYQSQSSFQSESSFQSNPSPPHHFAYQSSLPNPPHAPPPGPYHQYSMPPNLQDPYQGSASPPPEMPPVVPVEKKKKKKSFLGKLRKTFEEEDEFERDVKVNGFSVPDSQVKKAEARAGPISPGDYWYDVLAGFWGTMDGPCLGIIPAGINELVRNKKSEEQGGSGVNALQQHFSGGTTGVIINGRELTPRDLKVLKSRGLSEEPRAYRLDISGQLTDALSNQPLMQLGHLATSLAQGQRGQGMRIPDEEIRRRKLEEMRKVLAEQQNARPIVARVSQ